MVKRYSYTEGDRCPLLDDHGDLVDYSAYQELEAENTRLRQQRDAVNAQLDFLTEEMKKAP
jgi:hypothetical protein|nr:MAG TPA: B-ZIP transcription factor [Caudoviricetes sp.]